MAMVSMTSVIQKIEELNQEILEAFAAVGIEIKIINLLKE